MHRPPKRRFPTPTTSPKPSRAALLLRAAMEREGVDRLSLAAATGLTREAMEAQQSGATVMPIETQRRLAVYLIEKVPALARRAHTLLAQVTAAGEYAQGRTETHNGSPPLTHGLPRPLTRRG